VSHPKLSSRVADLHASPIREILAVISRPGMVSFAGGLPAAETFPKIALEVPHDVLQYGPSEGETPLRERIAQELCDLGLHCDAQQVLILSGSQQGIDLVAKLFIDRGTRVAVESPTYLAALQVFNFFGADLVEFVPDKLDAAAFATQRPSLLYAIPTFQNPTGQCYDNAQRAALAAACDAHDMVLFEDDPYRDLCYSACDRTPVCAQLKSASWIYQGSFSKTFAPGLRLGFMVASKNLITPLTRLKQAADLHSNRVSQWLVLQHLQSSGRAAHREQLIASYTRKRDEFARLLDEHFSDLAEWQIPAGGLFFWLKLKRLIDTRTLLPLAIDQHVAFMPGEPFYPHASGASGTLRLNFSHAGSKEAAQGLQRLAQLIRNHP